MRIFSTIDEIQETFPVPVVTLGNFDGVHLGHQSLFKQVQERAQQLRGTSIVLTFDPHPQRILYPEREFYLINHIEEKREIIRQCGIDVLICMVFTQEFAAQDPEEFVKKVLVEKLHLHEMYVGYDSRFGQGKKGSPEMLKSLGERYGFHTVIIPPITHNGLVASSTKIRQLIRQGQIGQAAQLLNRPYAIDGSVVPGTQRGANLLGYPTANIDVIHELIPKSGVYICYIKWNKHNYPAVINVGSNPTFHANHVTVEAYLLDFHHDLYGSQISAHFLKRIRDELTFPNARTLVEQIDHDVCVARAYFQTKSVLI
ncbi:riboflavin biosynthesis protein RibF [candidate division KSB3 bacterium]|uniref:Riboflavin biosynthesis protein n=1 Tax=candidate division KSB3 bacterium TaxID=2044937 RepID=A0A2G6KFZ8_9BACT|nr:MAG: riboflavin biosynthesis protein RibF [candidate division KSB3 bacterium]